MISEAIQLPSVKEYLSEVPQLFQNVMEEFRKQEKGILAIFINNFFTLTMFKFSHYRN